MTDASMYENWKEVDKAARFLRSKIDACHHDWRSATTQTTVRRRVYSQLDGFMVDNGSAYAMRHERRCVTCGLRQQAIQADPDQRLEWKDF